MSDETLSSRQWRILVTAGSSDAPHTSEFHVALCATMPAEARLTVKVRDAQVGCSPGCAWIVASPEMAELLLPAVAAFARIETELDLLEHEVETAWPALTADRALAFDATPTDLKRSAVLAERVAATFGRRIRLARLEPQTLAHGNDLAPAAAALLEKLIEEAEMEERIEVLSDQCEVFEHIYEMGSQRLGEFRAAHHGARIEWIIVALLAAEILLSLLSLLKSGAAH